MPIGNNLDIRLRQAESHSKDWIKIDPTNEAIYLQQPSGGLVAGTHTVVIESYDANSSVKSALKTDLIVVNVNQNIEQIPGVPP